MKKILYLFICLGLLMPGSSSVSSVYGQAGDKRQTRAASQASAKSAAKSAPGKREAVEAAARARREGSAAAGNPCTTATPITVGQTVNGNLASGDCLLPDGTFIDFYSFTGTAGQAIIVSQTSSVFDTYLYLLDDQDDTLEENDDSGTGTNSRIPEGVGVYILPYTGEYTIGANSFDPSVGAYSVTLATDPACAPTNIAYNQTVNGTLATTDCTIGLAGEPYYTDLYRFTGTAGQQISISMSSANVDAYLVLHTPTGAGTLSDDDSGGGTNARIPAGTGLLTLTQTGTYTIEASTASMGQVGAYTLVLTGPATQPTVRAPFDFDGDGKTDVGITRPTGAAGREWWYQKSSDQQTTALQFGVSTDVPVPADLTGDGKTDIAFFRPQTGEWFVLRSEDFTFYAFPFGQNGDVPVTGDFDADGKADTGVFRPSVATWFIVKSSGGTIIQTFGTPTDKPVVADYDGDGKADIAIYRNNNGTSEWWIQRSSDLQVAALQFGAATDKAVPGDYTGDGKADVAFFRPQTGEWFILRSENGSFYAFPFGGAGDISVPGDYDGDGKTDAAVFRPSTTNWFVQRSTAGTLITAFGAPTDVPIPSVYTP